MDDIRERFRMLQRQTRVASEGLVERADADLRRRAEALRAYEAVAMPTFPTESSPGLTGAGPGEDALSARGLRQVPLDQIDFKDNPIVDEFHKGGTTRSDYRWAVATWADVVEPAVLEGADRGYFEARDAERGATGWRQTATVYDLFIGSEAITLSRRADGSLDPQGGRHRIAIARELGLSQLPARLL
jgi:hypothetical protein